MNNFRRKETGTLHLERSSNEDTTTGVPYD